MIRLGSSSTSKNYWYIMEDVSPIKKKQTWKWRQFYKNVRTMDYAKAEAAILSSIAEEAHGTPTKQKAPLVMEAKTQKKAVQNRSIQTMVRRRKQWTTHTRQR
jgi:hypothetical protein